MTVNVLKPVHNMCVQKHFSLHSQTVVLVKTNILQKNNFHSTVNTVLHIDLVSRPPKTRCPHSC